VPCVEQGVAHQVQTTSTPRSDAGLLDEQALADRLFNILFT
jgi:hypothetical protein